MKVSPLAMIPHKSRLFLAILGLSFSICPSLGKDIKSANEIIEKTAPQWAIDQLGHSLTRTIHVFAEADDSAKIFMAKWDIKDGFWCLDCQEGEEWNFCYVLPQPAGKPTKILVPTSLHMGWIESPLFFCVVSETGRDVTSQYTDTLVGSLPTHKFTKYTTTGKDYKEFPPMDRTNSS